MENEYSQQLVVAGMCMVLHEMVKNGDELSAQVMAELLAAKVPAVPKAALFVIACKVLRLHFNPIGPEDVDLANLHADDAEEAHKFFAAEWLRKAEDIRKELQTLREGTH